MTTKTRPDRQTEREILTDWVNLGLRPNVALTFTLFKAIRPRGPHASGWWEQGDEYTYSRAYDQFIRRLSKKLYGAKIYRRHRRLIPNGAALEGDGSRKRFHLHGFLRLPDEMLGDEFPKFEQLCRSVWRKSPWAMPDIVIEEIAYDWVGYSLKEGPEALLTGTLSF